MNFVSTLLGTTGTVVQVVLLLLLLRGYLRRYALIFVFCLVQLAITLLEGYVFAGTGVGSRLYVTIYWTDEVIIDLLMFILVIGFTYRALEGSPLRAKFEKILVGVFLAVLLLPFLLYYTRGMFTTAWFNGTAQILNFGAALMNLALWTALIATRTRDRQLMTVCVGLGIAVTGSAISFGLRQFSAVQGNVLRDIGNLLGQVTHLAGILIWCWAFRHKANSEAPMTS